MEIRYVSQADIMMLVLRRKAPVDSIEESGGVIISCGVDREPVSVEFLQASRREFIDPDQKSCRA